MPHAESLKVHQEDAERGLELQCSVFLGALAGYKCSSWLFWLIRLHRASLGANGHLWREKPLPDSLARKEKAEVKPKPPENTRFFPVAAE